MNAYTIVGLVLVGLFLLMVLKESYDSNQRMKRILGKAKEAFGTYNSERLSSDEMVCKMYRDGWVSKIIDKVTKLQPNAKSVEAEIYKKLERR